MAKPKFNLNRHQQQLEINFRGDMFSKPHKEVKTKAKSDTEILTDYIRRLFIEIKTLRMEVRDLKNVIEHIKCTQS